MLPTAHSRAAPSATDMFRSRWAARVAPVVIGGFLLLWWMASPAPHGFPILASPDTPPPPPPPPPPPHPPARPPAAGRPIPPPPVHVPLAGGGNNVNTQAPKPPPAPDSHLNATHWTDRAEAVKQSFLFAYRSYEKTAFPKDELDPVLNRGVDVFNGWGMTTVDSLSTLHLMGLHDEYQRGLDHISNLDFRRHNESVPFFETTIRYLGGLLSAYGLTHDPILLARADDLGSVMLPVFNTSSGLPVYSVNPSNQLTAHSWAYGSSLLAEMASCQMEYKYLAHLTGRKEYFQTVERVMDIMQKHQAPNGLLATNWNVFNGTPIAEDYSVGGCADSGYEYLLKQYLLTSKSEPKMLRMYLKAVNGILENMLFLSPSRQLLYVTDLKYGHSTNKLEHLSCFFPGLLALGAKTLSLPPKTAQLHKWAAEGLATTCYLMYADQPSGLGAEAVSFERWGASGPAAVYGTDPPDLGKTVLAPVAGQANGMMRGSVKGKTQGRWMDAVKVWEDQGRVGDVPPGVRGGKPVVTGEGRKDYGLWDNRYLLRPETIESIFLMWRTTGDEIWRERGWEIYKSIEAATRTAYGYASVSNVATLHPMHTTSMPSYFFAETLKYLFLLFSDESVLPLDKYVLNTEAHPLPIFEWTEWEKRHFSITP